MRKVSIPLTHSFFVAALLFSFPLLISAQNREKFVISARAGGVNAVTGRATVRGRGTGEWQQLMITEDLERGDVVKTGQDGRVEVLLNPGSYMRLAENSEFELSNNSIENLEVRLIRGTAIMEVTGADDTELLINVTTPHTRMAIVRRGLYRVNVVPGDATELIVRKGRVMLEGFHTKIKGGDKVVISSGHTFSVARLNKADKKNVDTFEVWSKQRAETVAQANRKIKNRDVSLLLASYNDPWSRGFRSGGMWVYNPKTACYTFMPFYSGWGSPYGNSYSSAFYGGYYGGNYCCGHQPYPAGNTPGSPTSGSPSGSGNPTRTYSPSGIPAAAAGKVERLNDRQPNP
ncbi:MAG: FecR domain-containing protein [Pyrinomonadaceae bacterium]|nr:FecR domain-containing protein [Pyrinomonadaceae bacterium]